MEKTAVEYLIEQLEFALPNIEWSNYRNETDKALEMERGQINDLKEQMALKDAAYSEIANRYSHLLLKINKQD